MENQIKIDEKTDGASIRKHIETAINHFHSQIQHFEANLAPGFRRRRSGYDQLKEKGLLNVDFIYREYPLILGKQSVLPSSQRRTIQSIGDEAIALYLAERRRMEEQKKQSAKQ